jgi:hypothetical protein
MLAPLTREFLVPRRFLLAIPVLAALWAAYDAYSILDFHARYSSLSKPADVYWNLVDVFAVKYVVAFVACVILRRARISALGGLLLLLSLIGSSGALALLAVRPMFDRGIYLLAIGQINLLTEPRGDGILPFLLLISGVPILVIALLVATFVVVPIRLLAGERIFSRPGLAMWGTHFAVSLIAVVLAFRGSGALAPEGYLSNLVGGAAGVAPLSAALIVFLMIGIVHWALCGHGLRRRAEGAETHLRVWLCAAIVAGFTVVSPSLIAGRWGALFSTTVVRPALRAVGILSTPKLEIGSVRVDLPYVDFGIGGATTEGAKRELYIKAFAHHYRSGAHPGESIDVAIYARSDLMILARDTADNGYSGDHRYIEKDLSHALQQPDAASKLLTLRFDFSGSRIYRSVARYMPDHPDLVFTARVRSRAVAFEELEDVLDRFIAERVQPAVPTSSAAQDSR